MNGRFLLDTNIAIALIAKERIVMQKIGNAEEIFVPAVVIGELFWGAYNSTMIEKNIVNIREFIAGNTVLPCDTQTGEHYGEIRMQLKRKGKPIPENDIWIAAIAKQYDLILVSRDSHFKEITGLKLEIW